MHHSVATVPLAVAAAMLYARFAASSTRPGMCRLFMLTPVLALLLMLPFLVPLYGVRGLAAFFLVWLGEFKLLLLAFGHHGPLDPHMRPLQFVFTAALPVKLRQVSNDAAVTETETKTKTIALPPLLPAASWSFATFTAAMIKFHIAAAISQHLHNNFKEWTTRPFAADILYRAIVYCILNSISRCLAAMGKALGMELEPHFNKPYLSASLQDFWGRRWSLMASAAVLRPSVYNPVRARLGVPAGVLATFLVSGLMHEVVVYYLTFRAPTGQVTTFFLLHGACVCAERWCGVRPPCLVTTPLVVAFVAGTACWLLLPAIFGDRMYCVYLAETVALASWFHDVGEGLLCRLVGSLCRDRTSSTVVPT